MYDDNRSYNFECVGYEICEFQCWPDAQMVRAWLLYIKGCWDSTGMCIRCSRSCLPSLPADCISFAMKYSLAIGALAATASAVPSVIARGEKKIRQYGYPTTKPIVNAVRPLQIMICFGMVADQVLDSSESCYHSGESASWRAAARGFCVRFRGT